MLKTIFILILFVFVFSAESCEEANSRHRAAYQEMVDAACSSRGGYLYTSAPEGTAFGTRTRHIVCADGTTVPAPKWY